MGWFGRTKDTEMQRLRGAGLSLAQASRIAQDGRGGGALVIIGGCVGMALIGAIAVIGLGLTSTPPAPSQTAMVAPEPVQPLAGPAPAPLSQALAVPPSPGAFAVAETAPEAPPQPNPVRDAILAARGQAAPELAGNDVTRTASGPLDPAPAATDCISELDAFLDPLFVQFDLGRTVISPSDEVLLERISERILACDDAYIMVAGHSDSVGDDLTNLALSWERADRTLARLVDLGVDPAAVEAIGYGARAPVSQGSDENLGTDRRVDFRVLPRRDVQP